MIGPIGSGGIPIGTGGAAGSGTGGASAGDVSGRDRQPAPTGCSCRMSGRASSAASYASLGLLLALFVRRSRSHARLRS